MVVHPHAVKSLVLAARDEVCQTRERDADGDPNIYLHEKPLRDARERTTARQAKLFGRAAHRLSRGWCRLRVDGWLAVGELIPIAVCQRSGAADGSLTAIITVISMAGVHNVFTEPAKTAQSSVS